MFSFDRSSIAIVVLFYRWKKAFSDEQSNYDDMKVFKNLKIALSLPAEERRYCPRCGVLLGKECVSIQGTADACEEEDVSSQGGVLQAAAAADLPVTRKMASHEGHGVIEGISDAQLEDPSTLLNPFNDRKAQAVSFLGELWTSARL